MSEKKNSALYLIAVTLLAAAIVVPRIYAGTLLVKYDILFWKSSGGGYAPTELALVSKFIAFGVGCFFLYGVWRSRTARAKWAIALVVSVLAFLSISVPTSWDRYQAIARAQPLIGLISAYHKEHGRYPDQLSELAGVPHTGLAPARRFYYASATSDKDDSGSWFPSARRFHGKSPYVICVPLIPGGTLVYRPDGKYYDLQGGGDEPDGWYTSSID